MDELSRNPSHLRSPLPFRYYDQTINFSLLLYPSLIDPLEESRGVNHLFGPVTPYPGRLSSSGPSVG